MLFCLIRGRWRQRSLHWLWAEPRAYWQVRHLWQPAPVCRELPGCSARSVGLPGCHGFIMLYTQTYMFISTSYIHGHICALQCTQNLTLKHIKAESHDIKSPARCLRLKNTDMQSELHPSCKFIWLSIFYLLMQLILISTHEKICDIFCFLFIFVFTDLYHVVSLIMLIVC